MNKGLGVWQLPVDSSIAKTSNNTFSEHAEMQSSTGV
jgi:hypothetical protein